MAASTWPPAHLCRVARGGSLLCPPGLPHAVLMDQVTCNIVQLPAAAVTRLAGRLGVDAVDFRFGGVEPVLADLNRHWRATSAYLFHSFAGSDPAVSNPFILAARRWGFAASGRFAVEYRKAFGRSPGETLGI